MCGIVGVVRFDKQPVDAARLQRQTDLLAHRGPDGHGTWVDDSVGLGHTRLSIIDLSEAGHQPMVSSDGNQVLIYNGELYNYRQLRQNLNRRYNFRGNSDTEVLLYSLIEKGNLVFDQLEGMFAFAYYNRLSRKLWLVRDPFGIKPLYYHSNHNRLVFSSEIKPLFLDPETPRRPDHDALRQCLLLGYSVNPVTCFQDIRRLSPGHFLEVGEDGNCTVRAYWEAESLLSMPVKPFGETLDESVCLHAVSDVPTGILLSGGIDSNLILSSLSRQNQVKPGFRAYNLGVESDDTLRDSQQITERANAMWSASHFGVPLEKIDAQRSPYSSIEKLMYSIEEPIGDPTHRVVDLICASARQHGSTVLFSGHGADEAFAGYRRHVWARYLKLMRLASGAVPIASLLSKHRGTLVQRMLASLRRSSYHPLVSLAAVGWDLVEQEGVSPDWFPPERLEGTIAPVAALLQRWSGMSYLKQMMMLDMHTYLTDQNLINVDKASMRRSVEIRVPFLYRQLVALGLQTPDHKLISRMQHKVVPRRFARDNLLASLVNAPKMGFGSPESLLIVQEEAKELLFSTTTRQRGLFSTTNLYRLWSQVTPSSSHLAMQLYKIVVIEQWFRLFIDNDPLQEQSLPEWPEVPVPTPMGTWTISPSGMQQEIQ